MKEGRQLVKEAVQDAKALKDAALQSAKNELIESLTPGIKALLEKQVKNLSEKRGLTGKIGQSQRGDYFSPKAQKWEESKEKGDEAMDKDKELDMESIAGFFPALAEDPGMEMPPGLDDQDPNAMEADLAAQSMQGMGIPMLGEEPGAAPEGEEEPKMKDDEQKEGDMDEMGEHVEISTEELKRFYEAALQTEVQVKKGFSDMVGGGELDQAAKESGILDKKSGEAAWEGEEPPAAEKWIPENLQSLVKAGLAENKALRAALKERNEMLKATILKLEEVNLFNAKVLHVNRLLNKHGRLNVEQKKVAVESLDKARSISEVKTIYEAIDKTFAIAGKGLAEGKSAARKPMANAQRARTSGAPNDKVLRESVDRGGEAKNGRWQKLAGLVK